MLEESNRRDAALEAILQVCIKVQPHSARRTPNDPKLSRSGPGTGALSTTAQGEGAGCAGASGMEAQPVTEPVGTKQPSRTETALPAVGCSAWLGALVLIGLLYGAVSRVEAGSIVTPAEREQATCAFGFDSEKMQRRSCASRHINFRVLESDIRIRNGLFNLL